MEMWGVSIAWGQVNSLVKRFTWGDQGFKIALRGGGSPPSEGEWKIFLRGFYWVVGTCRGVILTIRTFFKAKNSVNAEYQLKSKLA